MASTSSDGPRLTPIGRAFLFLFIVACLAGAYYLFTGKQSFSGTGRVFGTLIRGGSQVEIGVAYGTEKEGWFEWAASEFAKTPNGRRIKVNLIPMGSLEGAQALLDGDQRVNAWSPASVVYKDVFAQQWKAKYTGDPIIREESLALTPMAFVMWDERYQAFVQKYRALSFDTINHALQDNGGWDAIAQHPEWGQFKFGLAQPNQTNSGLMMIVLAAYMHQHKTKNLSPKDVLDPGFQKWLDELEGGASGMSNSTGRLMQEMILKGPSSYDALLTYENLAIESLVNAEGRWGKLRIVYPEYNLWNDNPYYIVNAPWSTVDQRKAADAFLNYLLTEPAQKESLKHGFRPANANVPVKAADSPLMQYAASGVRVDLQRMCEPPSAEVVSSLLASWQRAQNNR